ncbi:MAG: hypothetical protein GY747_11955 [Planctomycetes bacterium]|nr:hypothetical protein [Planctomycetota bacterium]MCP4771707.1 hypothetical protein [Planctomycetota bacterium]
MGLYLIAVTIPEIRFGLQDYALSKRAKQAPEQAFVEARGWPDWAGSEVIYDSEDGFLVVD